MRVNSQAFNFINHCATANCPLPTANCLPPTSFQSELPEHAVLFLVEQLFAFRDAPEAHVLPTPDRELVEERHAVAALDCREQGAIARIQMLIAAPPVACVVDGLFVFRSAVWIARIDAPEIRQERDETTRALIDSVAHTLRAADFGPRKNLVGERFGQTTRRRRIC